MTIEEIIQYVIYTPHNTNASVLTSMLKALIRDNSGIESPDYPTEVIYDGGVEI